jgi:hypothetical protein
MQTLAKGTAVSAHSARYCSGECMTKMYLSETERLRAAIYSGSGSRSLTMWVAPHGFAEGGRFGAQGRGDDSGEVEVRAICDAMDPTPDKWREKSQWPLLRYAVPGDTVTKSERGVHQEFREEEIEEMAEPPAPLMINRAACSPLLISMRSANASYTVMYVSGIAAASTKSKLCDFLAMDRASTSWNSALRIVPE